MKKKYTFIDLFAGCGGLSLGLEQAGFEVVFMNEIVETFASTYLANHNLKEGQYFIGDINELNKCLDKYSDILKTPDKPITLVCGGPPCQGFSMANRQRIIDDPRNQLYKAYLQFLSEVRPQFFIMENVKGMANKFDEIITNFKEYLGEEYIYDYRLLKVQDFGIPQNRERFIMIGNRMGIDPNEIFTEIERHKRPPFVLKDALYGLPHLEARKEKNKGEYESLECGFTERDFSYPDTDFYHFINGDKVITFTKADDMYVPAQYYIYNPGQVPNVDEVFTPFDGDYDFTPYNELVGYEVTQICQTSFLLQNGIVTGWKWKGNDCVAN